MEHLNQYQTLTYREANPLDLQLIIELQKQSFKQIDHLKKETIRRLLLNKKSTIIFDIIVLDNKPIGFAIYFTRSNSRKIRLYLFCISPKFSGRGFGLEYLKQRIDALTTSFANITLEVRVSNLPALNLYQKLGFKVAKILPAYYDDKEDGYRMIKKLF